VKGWNNAINDLLTLEPTPGQTVESVAAILETETQATIDDWLQRIVDENLPDPVGVEAQARSSHLPALFHELISRLRDPILLGSTIRSSQGAAAHGRLRLKQGYSAATLIEESRCLQVSIFHTLNMNSHRLDFNRLLPDVMVIADEVDAQLAQAMTSYESGLSQIRKSFIAPV
jgi:hypothetical protein